MRIHLLAAALCSACANLAAAQSAKAPEFHPLNVPAGKAAGDLKPAPVRADEPVILQLKAQRRADGSLEFRCDHEDPAAAHAESDAEVVR